jgi:ATP-dependent helicase/nuclease subunit B
MDPFVQQLADLCRAHVTRSKWVFVPTHAVGWTIGERIALDGTNWLNLRFVTPLDIALRMGAPFLVERGIDPSEEGLGPALMMRLLLDLPMEGGYFRPLADQPTMAQALWTTVRELRLAGVKADELKADAFESPAKHAELRALLASYERFLASNSRGDMAVVYEEAVKHPDWCPIQPEDCWTELPDTIWAPLQRRLIDVMPGERILPRALEIPGATIPRRLLAGSVVRIQPEGDSTPLAWLMAPNGKLQTANCEPPVAPSGAVRGQDPPAAAIELFHAGGRDAEIEEVFRRILARGASLDQVEIACASDAHVALVWEKALRHEWAVTLGPGIAAPSTRPGRALIGLCDWIETDFSAGHLRRLLQSGDVGIEGEDEGFTAGQAARTLGRAEAGWGRATYELSLGLLRKSYETRANDPDLSDDEREAAEEKAALTAKVAAWIAKLVASIPEPSADGKVSLQGVVDAALTFLERSTSRASQLDHRAATALADYVVELHALGPFACSLQEALRFIRERVESLNVAAERPRPGSLYACRLQQAGYSGRPHLYVVGLEEGRVFPAASEDPVLLDAERAGISPALKQSTDRIDESVWSVLSRLATWGEAPSAPAAPLAPRPAAPLAPVAPLAPAPLAPLGPLAPLAPLPVLLSAPRVSLSYSTRDTREFRETYASWLMLQAFRLQQGSATASYKEMKDALGEPVSSVPLKREAAATESAWWLRTVVSTGDKGIEAVEASFAPLARGREAAGERDSERFTGFDGYVPDAGKVLDPCAAGNAFSVTDLEGAAACPYRFFLKRGLGLRPLDEDERDKDVWLDPSTKGSELHALYASVLRRCRDAGRRPDLEKDGAWLTALAQGALERLNREMPPASAEILARESADFLADVELFLEGECEPSSSEPIGFEVSFGRPLGEEEEALARAEPVEIDLGGGLIFRIAGRIDRIDKVGPSDFQVLDYKTGGFWRDDWQGTFAGGRRLQHALYGLAVVELLRRKYKKPRVTGAVYYFSSHKGRRELVRIAAPTPAQTAAVLADLRELIVKGAFVHAPDERACKWCDFAGACDVREQDQAAGKLEDPKLKAYGRLAAHV